MLLLPLGSLIFASPETIDSLNEGNLGVLFIAPFLLWNFAAWILMILNRQKSGEWNMFAILSASLPLVVGGFRIIYSVLFEAGGTYFFTFAFPVTGAATFILALIGMYSSQRTKKGTNLAAIGLTMGVIILLYSLPLFLFWLALYTGVAKPLYPL